MRDLEHEVAMDQPMQRRLLLRGAIASVGGLAVAAGLLPGATEPAQAAPSDPDHGRIVTPNPIVARIRASGVAVELIDFCAPPRTSASKPYARLNFLYHAHDGTGFLYACDNRGKIWRINHRTGAVSMFLDFALARGSALLIDPSERGLRSFAFHPNFARQGAVGYNKLYTLSTETVGSRPSGVQVFGGPFPITSHNVLAEWAVFAGNRTRVDPASRRELLRIAQHASNHNTDQVMFDPNTRPGQAGHGKLFVATGDGGGGGDPHNVAQNPGVMLGKIIRIDPTDNRAGARYGVPRYNPFYGRAGYLPHIWALGVRHPQNMCFDTGLERKFVFSDIGQKHIEEVNLMVKGANYGWPLREGTFVTDRSNLSTLYALGPNDAQRRFTYPVAQYDHSEGRAITGGFVYRGRQVPALVGHYLCGDIVNGRIFHVPVSQLRLGSRATLKELMLLRNGAPITLRTLVDGANGRVDLRFGQGEDGEVYVLTKQDGMIRRLATPA